MIMLALVGIMILILMPWIGFGTGLPKKYRSRKCQGATWRRAFPQVAKDDIREFLLLFTAAFAFRDSGKLNFGPSDGIWEIYRDLYPSRWIPDVLELETLSDDMEKRHGIALCDIWSEKLTLGELFSYVQRFRA